MTGRRAQKILESKVRTATPFLPTMKTLRAPNRMSAWRTNYAAELQLAEGTSLRRGAARPRFRFQT